MADMVTPGSSAAEPHNEVHLDVTRSTAVAEISALLQATNGELASVVGVDERPLGRGFAVYYVIAQRTADCFTHVRVAVPETDQTFPAITTAVPAANWGERAVHDLLGLRPEGHPDPRPLVLHEGWPVGYYPLRRDAQPVTYTPASQMSATAAAADPHAYESQVVTGEGLVQVPVGPIHAGIIEPGHFRFSTSGEKVLHLDARLFYTHRGIEKQVEGRSVQQAAPVVEATCGACSVSHAIAFARACERLAGQPAPQRAERWRAILLELERLYNHIGDVGNLCAGVGLAYAVQRGGVLKEKLMQLNEELTGHRFLRHIVVPGGLSRDLEVGCVPQAVTAIAAEFASLTAQLWEEASLLDRLQNTGILGAEQAHRMGVVGPAARASGVSCDWRISHPQPGYEGLQLQMQECLRQSGDVEARALVRVDEAAASAGIVSALCDMLGDGPVSEKLGPMRSGVPALGYCESARGAMVHWLMAEKGNRIYRLHIRSASFANWPAVPSAVVGNIVPDFPLINKSFELCYACCDR